MRTFYSALKLIIKTIFIFSIAFLILFTANYKMTAFLEKEKNLQRELLRDMLPAEIAWTTENVHYKGQFNEIYSQNIKADVMILGTSHANRAINPYWLEQGSYLLDENIGYLSYFNFAMDGACPSYYLDWWEQIIIPSGYPLPKLVIFSVDWFMFDHNWLWRRIEQDYMYMQTPPSQNDGTNDKNNFFDLFEDINWFDTENTLTTLFNRIPLIYARDRIFEMFSEPQTEAPKDALKIEDCPYYNGQIAIAGNYDGKLSIATCFSFEEEIEDFKKLLDIFEENNIPFMFLMVPEDLNARRARQYDENIELLNSIAAEYDIDFINYNEENLTYLSLSSDYYYDWGHMNWNGSTLFSKMLAEDLVPYINDILKLLK